MVVADKTRKPGLPVLVLGLLRDDQLSISEQWVESKVQNSVMSHTLTVLA